MGVALNYDPDLFAGVHSCVDCKLGAMRLENGYLPTPALPGKDYTYGGIGVVCEAPGADEEQRGEPLVGRAGRLADRLFQGADVPRSQLVLLNRVRCRPPGNKLKDWPEASVACDRWTMAELDRYKPAVVVLMGATAIEGVFGKQAKVGQVHGSFVAKDDRHPWGARVYMATYHPSAVLRAGGIDSELAQTVIADLKAAKQVHACLQS